ncbi:type II toxin-antitoxin system MqsR family toxin [Rhizobium leguminosarum]|uniref:type II toxin-antitoxin system MqsR family toxin n=1 Tax=Rhizobium leguminosarum TaxID=384 RepID=UPI0021BBBB54|nr:type II toxin-antitoxin system MqsR family toxin [Rhizobium leguminosarum]
MTVDLAGYCDDDLRGHRIWQDVYHVPAQGMVLYVKCQADVVTEFTLMPFKEK